MRVLAVTSMYPTAETPGYGAVVKEQVESLRALGLSVDVITIGSGRHDGTRDPAKYVRAVGVLRRALARSDPDLIHAHYGLCGAIATAQRRVPVVTTFHGSDTGYVRWQSYISWAVARATTPIFVDVQGAERLGVREATVIPCGVDLNRFEPIDRRDARRRLGWDEARRYLLLPGSRKQVVKRADLFDDVVERVQAEVENLVAVSLEQTPRAQVPLFMNAADVTLMTSDSEGSPVTVKESLACLTPVVSVPVGDVPRLIAGLPGCSVAARDPGALAGGVVRAFAAERCPELRQRVEPFAQERIAAQLAALYERVAAARRRR